ncbi:winged helix-turn-helix domain-containing protein [Micromonospora echinospora]|uniref:winged helix-turn-helix domain-containing protein n=1 Tax=Micromonospora echinospora TaxID=1877 RepID=UPI003A84F427
MPPSPKWAELAEHIRKQIASGELSPGEKLPSTAQLCQIHGVSSIVVRNAMLTLKAEGLVVGVPGVGVYVTEGATSEG